MVDFLREIGNAFSDSINIEDLLNIVLKSAKRITDAGAGVIYLKEPDDTLTARVIEGLFPPMVAIKSNTETKWTSKQKFIHDIIKSYPISKGEGILGMVFENHKSICLNTDEIEASRIIPQYKSDFLRIRSIMVVPLKVKNNVLGVMAVVNKRYQGEFTEQELGLLESLAEQAAVAIMNTKLSIDLAERKQLEWEMKVAEDIQTLLISQKLPNIPQYDFCAVTKPVRSLGGDYYDIVQLDHGRYGIIIADVSGKGVPGAITIALFRSLFRNYAFRYQSPAKVLIEINNWLYGEIKEDMFITALYAIISPNEGKLVWSRAGHEPILFYSHKEQAVHAFSGMGVMMGMTFGNDFDSYLEENEINVDPGDIITLYTDGVIEAQNKNGCEFGRDNVCHVIKANSNRPAKDIMDGIISQVRKFSSSPNFSDDLTLIVLKNSG